MHERSLDCEGVVDVGLIIIAHFDNPAKEEALHFLTKVLLQDVKAVIPATAFLGAYHVMTNYLKLPKADVASVLSKTLSLHSDALYENVRVEDINNSFNYSLAYSIESWDAFLLSLGKRLGTLTVFSIDGELKKKAKNFLVLNPIQAETMKKYHNFISNL